MLATTTDAILKIKIKAQQVPSFPFDVVYIVGKEHKALLPRMFPYSLCLPFNGELIERLRALHVDEMVTVTTTKRQTVPLNGKATGMEWILSTEDLQNSFMVVPVLPRTHDKTRSKRKKDRNPAYLLASMHRRGEHETKKGKTKTIEGDKKDNEFLAFFNDFAVMFTPRGSVRPICKMCPRHLEHVQGKCSLGEQKCYESLIIQAERTSPYEQLQTD